MFDPPAPSPGPVLPTPPPEWGSSECLLLGLPPQPPESGPPVEVALEPYTVDGELPPDVVGLVVQHNLFRLNRCYQGGLRTNPHLQGRVTARFVIGHGGHVSAIADGGSDLRDAAVVACTLHALSGLSFPQPQDGRSVRVRVPITYRRR